MPKRRLPFAHNAGSTLVCLVIAAAGFLASAFATRTASLLLLLIADSACLLIVSRAAGLRRDNGWRDEIRDVTACVAMLAAYAALGIDEFMIVGVDTPREIATTGRETIALLRNSLARRETDAFQPGAFAPRAGLETRATG